MGNNRADRAVNHTCACMLLVNVLDEAGGCGLEYGVLKDMNISLDAVEELDFDPVAWGEKILRNSMILVDEIEELGQAVPGDVRKAGFILKLALFDFGLASFDVDVSQQVLVMQKGFSEYREHRGGEDDWDSKALKKFCL